MKRSSQVALLLMGVGGVGAGGYALMPSNNCVPQGGTPPAVAVPGAAAPAQPCQPSRSSGSTSHSTTRTSSSGWSTPFYNRGSTSTTPTTSPSSIGTSTTRGGFGSIGSAIARSVGG